MKKSVLICLIFSLCCAVFGYPKEFEGTFIPEIFHEEILKTKSYGDAIKNTLKNDMYDVLCLRDGAIDYNVKFHDAARVFGSDFAFNEDDHGQFLIDNKTGQKYIKISDSKDYYDAFSEYLYKYVLAENLPEVFGTNLELKDGFIFQNKAWKVDRDKWHYLEDDLILIFYNRQTREYIGIVRENGEAVACPLKDGVELGKVRDGILTFSSHNFNSLADLKNFMTQTYNKAEKLYDEKKFGEAASLYFEVSKAYEAAKAQAVFSLDDESKKKNFYSLYNLACCKSLIEDDSARTYLLKAVDAGYPHSEHLAKDEDLKFAFGKFPTLLEESLIRMELKSKYQLKDFVLQPLYSSNVTRYFAYEVMDENQIFKNGIFLRFNGKSIVPLLSIKENKVYNSEKLLVDFSVHKDFYGLRYEDGLSRYPNIALVPYFKGGKSVTDAVIFEWKSGNYVEKRIDKNQL